MKALESLRQVRDPTAYDKRRARRRPDRILSVAAFVVVATTLAQPHRAHADEGGVSFWLPGTYGSLAAVPTRPGLGFATFFYNTSVSADASRAFFRGGRFTAGLHTDAPLVALVPSYTFATPVFGGQLALSMMSIVGHETTGVDAVLTAPLGSAIAGRASDSVNGWGDLYPSATLKWNQGVNNYMVYATGDIPVGLYNANSLANIGIGHSAIDGGFGYTYFDQAKGHEFSAVAGLTYNLINQHTQYQNGVDFHLDWGASQFLSKELLVGLVGYVYQEIGCDSGSGDRVGCFRSRVVGVGPQLGYLFPLGEWQGYLNLKGYGEFANDNRPAGWNVWLTFAVSPAAAPPPITQTSQMLRK
jgi:hypothetical protein